MIERKFAVMPPYLHDKITKEILLNIPSDASVSEAIDYLLSGESRYYIYEYESVGSTFKFRLIRLALAPFWVASMPFQWLFFGEIGVSRNTKFGRFLLKIGGEL